MIWTISKNSKSTKGFQPKPRNHQHFGRQGHVQPSARIAPKLQENPIGGNNGGHGSCRLSNHLSMDKLANSLSPEYSEFQSKYCAESLPKRFDTNNYSASFIVSSTKYWRGICFKGNSAQLFYENLKFKRLDWAVFDLDSTNLGRIDLCYDRELKSTDRDPHLFLENSCQTSNKNVTTNMPK